MKKGARRERPTPLRAADQAYHRWLTQYFRDKTPEGVRRLRFAWHAGVRWARQDERRRQAAAAVAAITKARDLRCASCGHYVRHHHPGGCTGGSGSDGTIAFMELPCSCAYVRAR